MKKSKVYYENNTPFFIALNHFSLIRLLVFLNILSIKVLKRRIKYGYDNDFIR